MTPTFVCTILVWTARLATSRNQSSGSLRTAGQQENCKVRGLVHFSARTDEIYQKSLPENMDLTRSRWTLQFS